MKLVQMLMVLMSMPSVFSFTHTARAAEDQILAKKDPIVVVALAKIKPGHEREFQNAVSLILPPTRQEPGNHGFVYHQSTTNPGEFAFVENWDSQDDLDAHMKTVHMQIFFGAVGSLFEPGFPQINSYRRVNE